MTQEMSELTGTVNNHRKAALVGWDNINLVTSVLHDFVYISGALGSV